ncbi:hypothetical protein NRA16_17775 [Acinetobacter baumannii]|nr:hypothetical protein [Acinetobacter baumannii]
MSKSTSDALRALAKGDSNRSETARLRDVIDDVEAALEAGVSRSAILETLHQQGFKMSLKSFESALYRIRKKRATGQFNKAANPLQTLVETTKNEDPSKLIKEHSRTSTQTPPTTKAATERKTGSFSHDPNSGNDRDDLI